MANSIFPSAGGTMLAADGSAAAPSYSFASNPSTGLFYAGNSFDAVANGLDLIRFNTLGEVIASNGQLGWCSGAMGTPSDTVLTRNAPGTLTLTGTTPMLQFGGTTSAFPALKAVSGNTLGVYTADGSSLSYLQAYSITAQGYIQIGSGSFLIQSTAPTIASGFGTSPSIPASNGSVAFAINVGTGAAASSGVLTMPAAGHGWIAICVDIGNTAGLHTYQTASTTTSITLTCQNITTGAATAWAASTLVYVIAMGY